jgi:hypothetical protein
VTVVPGLLSTVQDDEIRRTPFTHLVRQNALPAADYDQLAAEYPSLTTIAGQGELPSNIAVRLTAQEVLRHRSISVRWREFFEYHTSTSYWRNIVRLFANDLRREIPGLEERMGRAFADWRVVRRGSEGPADVRLDCQFVMNTPVARASSVKTPHIDQRDKIFSGLLYFRDPRDESTGGDLDLYRWRRPPRFVKHRALEADLERVETVKYAANCYLGFVNSESAVHGVSPRTVTSIPRRYINFIAELPFDAFAPRQVSRLQRLFLPLRRPKP